MRSETIAAIDVVARALELAKRTNGPGEIACKSGRDVVTATDIAVEDAVRELLTRTSTTPVIGEERGGHTPADGSPYWLVDPICGTRNFASGSPLYCVNLALVEGDRVTIAIVGDASTGEISVAELGGGAWALDRGVRRRLTTSEQHRTIVVEDGKSIGARREHAARFTADVLRADRWDFRSLGTTLALPYVAAGRVTAYALFAVSAVHAAAGSLLVTEAGGVLSDLEGRSWTLRSDSILASANADVHGELVALAVGVGKSL